MPQVLEMVSKDTGSNSGRLQDDNAVRLINTNFVDSLCQAQGTLVHPISNSVSIQLGARTARARATPEISGVSSQCQ